eukprot:EG_transcript_2413
MPSPTAELSEVIHRSVGDSDLEGLGHLPGMAPGKVTQLTQAPRQPAPLLKLALRRAGPPVASEGGRSPGWQACAGRSGGFLVPTVVLLGLSIGLFINEGEPFVWWYPAVFAAIALLSPFATWVAVHPHAQRQLRGRCSAGPRAGCPLVRFIHRTATNPCLSALSDGLPSPKVSVSHNRDDPLDFLLHDLAEWASSDDGWIIIDTTGIILWCNEAVRKYFGYEGDFLLQHNVRILMPPPYAAEHDFFLRKHLKTGFCRILGNPTGRPVPVVNRKGEQSMVVLSINDHLDPHDMANYVFSGRMRFGLQDAPLIKVRTKVAQGCDVAGACKVMDAEPLPRIVTDGRGSILYVNAAASKLFGWSRKELSGRNVKCLMGENHASQHDQYLKAYMDRVVEAQAAGGAVPSNIVGSGRDVMALTKDRRTIRIFLTVDRIDPPTGPPTAGHFHATMVPVTEADRSGMPSYPSAVRRCHARTVGKVQPSLCPGLKSPHSRPCTVVVAAIRGLCQTEFHMFQRTCAEALNLVMERAHAHRGVVQSIVGDCFVLIFNHSSLPNSSHRSSAADFLVELYEKWQYSLLSRPLALQAAAVCRSCFMAQLETQQLLLSDSVDACFCSLRAATEAQVCRPVIDGALYQELMYSWTCRLVNVATLWHFKQPPATLEIYELVELKQLTADDEWMYQIAGAEEDVWAHWAACWEELRAATPNYPAALVLLRRHLMTHPEDPPALWLQDVLRRGPAPRVIEFAGALPFSLLHRRGGSFTRDCF